MPYIKDYKRDDLKEYLNPVEAGEMNYLFTVIGDKYLDYHGKNYSTINDIIGALECAKLEFYRRIVAPYEDIKIEENGDVYVSA